MSAAVLALLLLQASPAPAAVTPPPDLPFRVGERFVYSAKLGIISLGEGTMSVAAVDTLRGVEAFRFEFTLKGGLIGFNVDDKLTSWTESRSLVSLRFHQAFHEKEGLRTRQFEIHADSGFYREVGRDRVRPTPKQPLDDTAFFYFIRTTPLEVGRTYEFRRYFRDDKNPVVIRVLKREELELPDGTKVACLQLHPLIDERNGMFSKRADARLWLTDDARRIPVQIRSRFVFGTVTLRLKELTLGAPSTPLLGPTAPVPAP